MANVQDGFREYLAHHNEIPAENFSVEILNGRDDSDNGLCIRIVLGNVEGYNPPRDVFLSFRPFVQMYRPLKVQVLRYFPAIEGMVRRPNAFYAPPNTYKPVDIGQS